jgi:hypothetical protein
LGSALANFSERLFAVNELAAVGFGAADGDFLAEFG